MWGALFLIKLNTVNIEWLESLASSIKIVNYLGITRENRNLQVDSDHPWWNPSYPIKIWIIKECNQFYVDASPPKSKLATVPTWPTVPYANIPTYEWPAMPTHNQTDPNARCPNTTKERKTKWGVGCVGQSFSLQYFEGGIL